MFPGQQLRHGLSMFRTVDVRGPQKGAQKKTAAENVQRQKTVVAIIAPVESAFLLAVNGIVRRVEVEYDLRRRLLVRRQKMLGIVDILTKVLRTLANIHSVVKQ